MFKISDFLKNKENVLEWLYLLFVVKKKKEGVVVDTV